MFFFNIVDNLFIICYIREKEKKKKTKAKLLISSISNLETKSFSLIQIFILQATNYH